VAAACTDPGVQREVNEDRFHVDPARGLFVVIDGIGGQAAGGKAADVALSMVRERLERQTGPVADRIREAIAIASNEIHRLAATRAEWSGMACVLTIAVVGDGRATIGHVGDTRLYKIRHGRIEKVTRDHSPVGEREDAGELSESQAMRHPRRNEVYRDVGSEPHDPGDIDFVDSEEIPFEPDAALLLCTDGLTDSIDSAAIGEIVARLAGDPDAVAAALVQAANAAGGKDNVTVVYVEGERFAERAMAPGSGSRSSGPGRAFTIFAVGAILAALVAVGLARTGLPLTLPWLQSSSPVIPPVVRAADVQVVHPTGSIADALRTAAPESEIIVEPGEYREQVVLKDRVRLVSRVPRGATIRLPGTVPDRDAIPAIVATGLTRAELVGFRIVGDAATPLSVGILVEDSALSIVDVHITGATRAAVEFSGGGAAALLGSEIRDNPGAALIVHERATPRIAHNLFSRNGTARAAGSLLVMSGAGPQFTGNVFLGVSPGAVASLDAAGRAKLENENWFVPVSQRRTSRSPARPRQKR
jgi:serine/threonine protein phosphatase PrpC